MAAEPIEPPVLLTQESSSAAEEIISLKVTLADLCAKGTSQHARKNYEAAADLYAQASQMQAELNGETNPENAEILFLYGRSLFEVGKAQSNVLGGKSGGGGDKTKKSGISKKKTHKTEPVEDELKRGLDKVTEETTERIADQEEPKNEPAKPLFTFTGDENFENSDDEEDAEGEEEEEEDDLATAFEVLDLGRVLFTRRLEAPEIREDEAKGKESGDSAMTKHIKERLADTHHLLGEISLENEKFDGAVTDFRAALELKQTIYPEEDEIIAEAHYLLSLALEFASIKPVPKEGEGEEDAEPDTQVDQTLRDEAAKEMEATINSIKLKLQNKEVELASSANSEDNDILRSQIVDSKEILADMEARLAELSKPPIDVKGMKESVFGGAGSENPLGGLLGANTGESTAEVDARIEEAKKNANDLSALVRKKKPIEAASNGTTSTNGKRKAEDDVEEASDSAKKAKVEDAPGE